MKKSRRKFSAAFKAQVAIEALKERSTLSELAKKFKVHSVQISKWKQEFVQNASAAFDGQEGTQDTEEEKLQLYAKIGQLEMERDWLKKNLNQLGLLK